MADSMGPENMIPQKVGEWSTVKEPFQFQEAKQVPETPVTRNPTETAAKDDSDGTVVRVLLAGIAIVAGLSFWIANDRGYERGWNEGYNHACNKFFGRAKRLNLLSQEHDAADDLESEAAEPE